MQLFIMEFGMDRYKITTFFYVTNSIDWPSALKLIFSFRMLQSRFILGTDTQRRLYKITEKRSLSLSLSLSLSVCLALNRKQLIHESFVYTSD